MQNLGVDLTRVEQLFAQERERFEQMNPGSKELHARGQQVFLYGTALHWMQAWPGSYPIYFKEASGARLWDVDGNEYLDLALGDSGAMFGHADPIVTEAIQRQAAKAVTAMLPCEDGVWVGEELKRRFALPYWQFATSASDANRFVIRLSRMISGRDKVLVFAGNYHGSVDETQVEFAASGEMVPRTNVHPNAMDHQRTSRLVEFNDVTALEAALRHRDVACVLAEPIMTNIGMVPALPGYHQALRELTRNYGTLLVIDETHTISTGPGGYTRAFGLEPDFFVLGKAIAGGIPAAVYGMTQEVAERIWGVKAPLALGGERRNNHSGFGGTLVGNALTLAAMRATLEHLMTEANYTYMISMANRLAAGIKQQIELHSLPWHVTQIGARLEFMFTPKSPHSGSEARLGRHGPLENTIRLFMLNRGLLITPFHNMELVCPAVKPRDVDKHNQIFAECLKELVG